MPLNKPFTGKQPMDVSVFYRDHGEDFSVEGKVMAHFIKIWDKHEEMERCLLTYWEGIEPFTRTNIQTQDTDEVTEDDLPFDAMEKIEWLICQSLG